MTEIASLLSRLPSPDEFSKLLTYLKPHEREQVLQALNHRIDPRFCPEYPHPKQQLFLSIDDLEVLFGGAAGGGKSSALLMAFLQYIDLPHYRGLILRRKSVDLDRSDAILSRAKQWWLPTSRTGVRYYAQKRMFVFPSGATCEFGHMNNESDILNYQGGAWQFIGFDEGTQFTGKQYVYMFSRARRKMEESGLPPIPIRIRATTNPGGPSHYFFRDRFMSLDYARKFLDGTAAQSFQRAIRRTIDGQTETVRRWFVPSKIKDNPSLDSREYMLGLSELDDVTKGQLLDGNWLITAAGRFRPEWFKRYRHPDLYESDYYQLLRGHNVDRVVHPEQDCFRIMTIDAAGTQAEVEAESKGREPSHSVISTFDITLPDKLMIWRDVRRFQKEFPEVIEEIKRAYAEEKPDRIVTEMDGIGKQVYQVLHRAGIPIEGISTMGKDKLARSAAAQAEAKEGRVYLPESAPWLDELEAELFVWTGLKAEVADQIDTFSYAAKIKSSSFTGEVTLDSMYHGGV